jgi:hypothetical protein
MLVQETLKKGRVLETATPYLPPRPAKLIGRIDWHCIRFMLAGVDGLLLQELAKPNQARSKRGIEALIRATQIANIRPLTGAGVQLNEQ